MGHGTTFKVYLPRVEAAEAAATAPAPESLPQPGSETILLVEDDAAVRRLIRGMLTGLGYQVLEASDAPSAVRTAHENKPIHLLLTDVIMPEMSGRQVYEQVAAVQPGIKVLYMSGYTGNVIAHHGILEDGIHFLQKPFTIQSLTQKIRTALAG